MPKNTPQWSTEGLKINETFALNPLSRAAYVFASGRMHDVATWARVASNRLMTSLEQNDMTVVNQEVASSGERGVSPNVDQAVTALQIGRAQPKHGRRVEVGVGSTRIFEDEIREVTAIEAALLANATGAETVFRLWRFCG